MKKSSLSFILVLFFFQAYSQIDITFPIEKAVFQRGVNNTAAINVAGNFSTFVDKVEAKFTPITGGATVDWITIHNNPTGGIYKGSVEVQGGWYKLEVRATLNGLLVGTATLQHVGVGEVFLIAGQSNAQGVYGKRAVGATDERVICVDNYNSSDNFSPTTPPLPRFSALKNGEMAFAPTGQSAWCWGKLGDLLTQRLNVPVLFFNAAASGQTANTWKTSASGQDVINPWAGFNQGQTPYIHLKFALNHYINTYGVRSILWHQGESDNHFGTAPQAYIADIKYVIDKTRSDLGKNIPWCVSRVSLDNNSIKPSLIDAQNQIINAPNLIFQGPSTDNIQNPRPDGVHFEGQGLIDLANAWNSSLDNNFLVNAIPVTGSSLITLNPSCQTNLTSLMTYTASENQTAYKWSNGVTTASASMNTGSLLLRAENSRGNVMFSQTVTVNAPTITPQKPIILLSGPANFCENTILKLTSNPADHIVWSTGEKTNSITVSKSDTYTVASTNAYGCKVTSEPVVAKILPAPKPVINASGPLTFCEDKNITLSSNSEPTELNTWSTGETSKSITVNTSGNYTLTVKNTSGCTTVATPAAVTVIPLPPTPKLTAQGYTTICSDEQVTLQQDSKLPVIWSTGEGSPSVKISQSGTYSVRSIGETGCLSIPATPITVVVRPVPDQPTISQIGTFTLQASTTDPTFKYEWKVEKNILNAQNPVVKSNQYGIYSVRAFKQYTRPEGNFSCFSEPSSPFDFNLDETLKGDLGVYPNPTTGIITIETKPDIQNGKIIIYREDGWEIFSTTITNLNERKVFDLNAYGRGRYIIRVKSADFDAAKRILIE